MSKPKRPGRVTATQGLVEGIMRAVATYNAEMRLEAPRMPQDVPTTAGPIERADPTAQEQGDRRMTGPSKARP
jgi:hypothetical protein